MKNPGILVVDNDTEILIVIGRMFSHFGVEVDCITSAVEAIDRLQKIPFRILIISFGLSDMVAMELARRAHEIDPDLNIVLFVADSQEQIMRLALEPTVSDASEEQGKSCELGDMLLDIRYRKTGKVFILK